jgi:signal recognition particle GTPase
MPFRHASRVLEDLLGVDVSSETTRRLCEDVGKQVEEKHTAQAQQPCCDVASAQEKPLSPICFHVDVAE